MAMLTLHCGRMSFYDEATGQVQVTFNQVYNININLITVIQKFYEKATSVVCSTTA